VTSIEQRPVVTLAGAQAAVAAGTRAAQDLGVVVAIAVVDPGGQDVAFAAMDGAALLVRGVARDKAWTAVAFGRPTDWWAELLAASPELAALGKNNRLMPVPGGVPVLVDSAVAGGIGVSGATAEQDAEIAAAALAALTEEPSP